MKDKKEAFLPTEYLFVAILGWTILVTILLFWDVRRILEYTENQAINEARTNFRKDMAFRYWATEKGGVYVPAGEGTPPNPYLQGVEERDVVTPSGKRLTLMNPAYIMRQVGEHFKGIYGVGGRLTSLRPLNPINAADEWEKKAFTAFENGETEVYEFVKRDGQKILRFIRPFFVEKGCLKCHGAQGYRVGDVRGGISITIPMYQYAGFERRELINHVTAHGLLWLMGLLGLLAGQNRLNFVFNSKLKTQEALAASEETRRLLLDNVAEAIFGTDRDGICDFANPACVKMLGYDSSEELVGQNIHSLIHHTHEDGSPFPESECVLNMVIREGKPAHVEREILWRKDGTGFMVEIWFHPVFKKGETAGTVVNFVDITGRLAAEKERARLFAAIEQTGEVVVITDPSGSIQYVNKAFEQTSGYSREEAIGANPRIMKSGRQSPEFYRNMWSVITSGATWKGSFINKRKDGRLYEEEAVISPVTGEDGAITGYVAVKRDVTRESMLRHAKDYFTTVTSHELRTPLTKLGLAKLLLEQAASSGKPDAASLRTSMDALEASMTGFQSVVTAGEMFTDLSLLNKNLLLLEAPLTPLLRYGTEILNKNLAKERRKLEIILDIDPAGGEFLIACDQAMIQYAINEVLSNAAKYTPDGRRVFVSLKRDEKLAFVVVRDEGIGLPRESRETAFEPLFSLETLDTHSSGKYSYLGGGIGMGLTLARLICQAHGGGLSLESEGEGRGATVVMTLPLHGVREA